MSLEASAERAVRVADVPPAVKSEMARLPMVVYLPGKERR